MVKCEHPKLELEECDEHGTGLDFYNCTNCQAQFAGVCRFIDGDPHTIPNVDTLDQLHKLAPGKRTTFGIRVD